MAEAGTNTWTITARGGELRAGYRMAARLDGCTIELGPGGWTVRARMVASDPYWLEYGPDRLVLEFSHSRHIFKVVADAVQIVGDHVAVRGQGKPEIQVYEPEDTERGD